jgi:hypothetical protein
MNGFSIVCHDQECALNDVRAFHRIFWAEIESFDFREGRGRMLTNESYISKLAVWSCIVRSRHS